MEGLHAGLLAIGLSSPKIYNAVQSAVSAAAGLLVGIIVGFLDEHC